MLSILLASVMTAPAAATPPAAPPIVSVPAPGDKAPSKSKAPDFAAMMSMFDKLFPPQPDPEPGRLAAARGVAQRMWPDGTYGMLFETFGTTIANTVLDMKPAELEMMSRKPAGKDTKPAALAADADLTLRQKMRRDDPHFDRRVAVITDALRAEFARVSPLIEPPLREGLSRSMARRFTAAQLADLDGFYQTPTGQVYARESLKMWFDADLMRSTMSSMPALMMQMPGAMQRVKAAAETVPPAPKKKKGTAKSSK